MPSNKILVVIIICASIIASVFLYQKSNLNEKLEEKGLITESRKEISTNYDWKKIFNDSSSTTVSWIENTKTVEETTITDQVAKDFFSQFIILKKSNGEITESDAINIAKNTFSSPELQKIRGVVYIESNLHITNVNSNTIKKYRDNMLEVSGILKSQKFLEDLSITKKAIESDNPSQLVKLDADIINYRTIILKLLEMSVPSDAKSIHLELLNSVSNVLFSLESMRNIFDDPIKGTLGIDRYQTYINQLSESSQKIQVYFDLKK